MRMTDEIKTELDKLARKARGLLKPCDVVEAARPDESPLHGAFEWDDSVAAQQYRIWQARELIVSVRVEMPAQGRTMQVQAFVSLPSDREQDGGGYRSISAVLRSRERKSELLEAALADLDRIRAKYGHLSELARVFAAVDAAKGCAA